MDIKELRIGNKLKVSDNYWTVSDILTNKNELYFKENNLVDYLVFAAPIELTEEILLKCPSIENRNTNPISYYLHNRIIFINDGLCFDYATRVKLPYLHTFQNFIFALTGKELEIKL